MGQDQRTFEQINHETKLFAAMIKDCCRLGMWCFSTDGSLLDSTYPESWEYMELLAANNALGPIFENPNSFHLPVLLEDAAGLYWSVNFIHQPDKPVVTSCLIVLGPVLGSTRMLAEAQETARRLKLPVTVTEPLAAKLEQVPVISDANFYQYIRMLHRILTGEVIGTGDVQLLCRSQADEQKPAPAFADPERALATEEKLLQMIREGSPEFGRAADPIVQDSPKSKEIAGEDLRAQKDTVIMFCALAARAAREGGVAAGTVLELRSRYVSKVERCRHRTELTALNQQMVSDFVEQVREARNNKDLSRAVRACCEYIKLHVTDPFDLHEMASSLGYTEYYLSRKFAKETGQKISTYLREARLERARMKLANTSETIQKISDELQFSSRNYFTKVFTKAYGVTPRDYREQYGVS